MGIQNSRGSWKSNLCEMEKMLLPQNGKKPKMTIGPRGGRSIKLGEKEYSITTLYKHIEKRCHHKGLSNEEKAAGRHLIDRLAILDKKGDVLLKDKNKTSNSQRNWTRLKRFADRFFHPFTSKQSIIKKIESKTVIDFSKLNTAQVKDLTKDQVIEWMNSGAWRRYSKAPNILSHMTLEQFKEIDFNRINKDVIDQHFCEALFYFDSFVKAIKPEDIHRFEMYIEPLLFNYLSPETLARVDFSKIEDDRLLKISENLWHKVDQLNFDQINEFLRLKDLSYQVRQIFKMKGIETAMS